MKFCCHNVDSVKANKVGNVALSLKQLVNNLKEI